MNRINANIQAALKQGMDHFQSGRLSQAEQIFRDVLLKAPTEINAMQLLGLVVFQLGRPQEGEKLLRKAIRKNKKIATLHINLGHMLDAQGKFNEALKVYKDAQKLDPRNDGIQTSLGMVFGKLGRLEEGIIACEKALKINPRNTSALANLGNLLWRTGKASDAIKILEQALYLQPNHIQALSNLGVILFSEKKLDRAEEVLRHALEHGGRLQTDVLCNLSTVLMAKGVEYYDEALGLSREAVNLAPNNPDVHFDHGRVLKQLDEWDQAIISYNKALSMKPEWIDAYCSLGNLYEKTHDIKNAESAVRKALSINPEYPQALYLRAVLLRRQGRIKEAIEILQKADCTDSRFNVDINFELGKLLDLDHNSSQALHYFSIGNKIAFENAYKADEMKAESLTEIDKLEEILESEKLSSLLSQQVQTDITAPIFLVGFPRSGTTLLDQILDSHSKLQVMEEKPSLYQVRSMIEDLPEGYPYAMESLMAKKINELREKYFEAVDFNIEREPNTILVDKLPLNLLHMPLIKMLFPNAKIILAIRHPCDVIISNFMQHFHINNAMANFSTLDDAVHYYGRTMSLWDKYSSSLSLDYHVVKYESVVENFSEEVAHLLEFLNLDWEEAIQNYHNHAAKRVIKTPSYQSVVKPIYNQAKFRWKNYGKQLEPYFEKLRPFVEKFGYSELDYI